MLPIGGTHLLYHITYQQVTLHNIHVWLLDGIDQRRISAATGPGICGSKYGKAKREPVRNGVEDGMPPRGWRRSRLGVEHFSYEKTLMSIDIRVSYEKVAATYSPTWWGSTIGDGELNFSVRNGKRWILTAITATICF